MTNDTESLVTEETPEQPKGRGPMTGRRGPGMKQVSLVQVERERMVRLHKLLEIGDTVYWYSSGLKDGQPVPAVVMEPPGHTSLTLHLYRVTGGKPQVRSGVRHHDDPDFQQMAAEVLATEGCWDFTPRLVKVIGATKLV